jgi:archaellum component FlaG (FlaF/FlaG flagellin family)
MKNKKGVSALIATILLIVVAVALIAIILTWGKSFTTGSLSDTGRAIDLACTGAAITISDCKIDTDSNLEFFVKNISSTYIFLDTDAFKVDLTDTSGGFNAGITMSTYTTTTWAGLSPGEIIKIDMNRTVAAPLVTGTNVGVTVKSSVCGNDAIATYSNCHQ